MADDIYEKNLYADTPFATPAAVARELAPRTLTINGVSRAYAMTGWRAGHRCQPLALIKAMNLVQSRSTSHEWAFRVERHFFFRHTCSFRIR
ncbi:aminotransferase class I/II-fold pyridoxal phosphate-dependent enzyme [Paraburkholderia aspalathi]|nr:aminotransferase class I/II-fold pyridoxal phosphate-dependent enzyme [Paraburkholderia aspalathi]